jgi:hypothetical protein
MSLFYYQILCFILQSEVISLRLSPAPGCSFIAFMPLVKLETNCFAFIM